MKIIIFTPIINSSAIGRASFLLSQSLYDHGVEVLIVRSEIPHFFQDRIHPFEGEIIEWNEFERVDNILRNTDVVIYAIGDNYHYHRGCLEWIDKYPGVVILHDFFVADLFNDWGIENKSRATSVIKAWYGDELSKLYSSDCCSFEFMVSNQIFLTEWICSLAYGVVTHAHWRIQSVLNSCPGPVSVTPLLYEITESDVNNSDLPSLKKNFTILTVGHVNPNKRIENIIRAIANSDIPAKNIVYRVVGTITEETHLNLVELARSLEVRVVISGALSDKELRFAIDEADIMCCLRLPALEAASASAIEAMMYGKPLIVMDTGFYQTLPDSCVRKISPDNELADLQAALEFLYKNKEERLALGRRAQEWASKTFCPENYATKILELIKLTLKAVPNLKASRYFSEILVSWGAKGSVEKNLTTF